MDRQHTQIRFPHGLGDHVYMAHLLSLYRSQGFEFTVAADRNKAAIYRACENVSFVSKSEDFPAAPWIHGTSVIAVSKENGFSANKVMANLSLTPLPDIGPASWEVWTELSAIVLDAMRFVVPEEAEPILCRLEKVARPLLLFHPKGNNLKHAKDLNDEEIRRVCADFATYSGGTVLMLDWDRRIRAPDHPRVAMMEECFGKKLSLAELIVLFSHADLLIGIDSGPAHLARMVPTLPVLFVWQRHHPFAFSLPRAGHLHILPHALAESAPRLLLSEFDCVEVAEDRPSPETIVEQALQILGVKMAPVLSFSESRRSCVPAGEFRNTQERPIALYSYSSDNIGDDMQSLVLRRWLGYEENEIRFFDRDKQSLVGEAMPKSIQLLINGFIGEGALPLRMNQGVEIHPIFLAIHMANVNHDNPEKLEQLRRFGPVGCRDHQALKECREHNVDAYFAGCPTILCEPDGVQQDIDILLIDFNPRTLPPLPERRIIRYSSNMKIPRNTTFAERSEMCLRRWNLLSRSRLIVTSKLHAAMPAIGMGRPVVFINDGIVCSGRLSAFPEQFRRYPVQANFSWEPEAHQIDVTEHRRLVEARLLERVGHLRRPK